MGGTVTDDTTDEWSVLDKKVFSLLGSIISSASLCSFFGTKYMDLLHLNSSCYYGWFMNSPTWLKFCFMSSVPLDE